MSDTLASAKKWAIERVELVFFNPFSRTWQFFQGHPEALGPSISLKTHTDDSVAARYRRQIQYLLSCVWRALDIAIQTGNSSAFRLFKPRSGERDYVHFQHDPDSLSRRAIEKLKSLPDCGKLWAAMLGIYGEALAHAGLKLDVAKNLSANFLHDRRITTILDAGDQGRPILLSRSEALAFISILPIMEHWDLPGLFQRHPLYPETPPCTQIHGERKEKRDVEEFRKKCQALREPRYTARMVYDDREKKQKPSHSETILGYDVQMELVVDDLSVPAKEDVSLPLVDFFTCCYMPHHHESELVPYLTYAFFFDTLQTALSGPGSSPVYFIGYPINCLGWRHFLQIHVRPLVSQPATARSLQEDWKSLHDAFNWPVMKHFLEAILHQVHVSAFQHYFFTQMAGSSSTVEGGSNDLTSSFCKYGNWLFPVLNIADEKTSWKYKKDIRQVPDRMSIWIGYKWDGARRGRKESLDVPDDCIKLKAGGLEIITPKLADSNPYIDILQEGRFELILGEQLELARHIQDSSKHRTHAMELDRQDSQEKSIRFLWSLDSKVSKALYEKIEQATTANAFRKILIPASQGKEEPAPKFTARWLHKPELELTNKDFLDVIDELRRILAPPMTIVLSEYFDVGPVKDLTHEGPYYVKEDGRENLATRFNRVAQVFQSLPGGVKRSLTDYFGRLQAFHKNCLNSNSILSRTVDPEIYKQFTEKFKIFGDVQFMGCRELAKATLVHREPRFRLNLCIGALLGEYLDSLFKQDGLFRLRTGAEPALLTWAVPSSEKYPGVEFWGNDGQQELRPTLYINYALLFGSLARQTSWKEVAGNSALTNFAHAAHYYGRTFLLYGQKEGCLAYELTHGRSSSAVRMEDISSLEGLIIAVNGWLRTDEGNLALALQFETWRQK